MTASAAARLERAFTVGPAGLPGRVTTAADRAGYAADLAGSSGPPPVAAGNQVSLADLAAAVAGRIGAGAGVDLVVTAIPAPDCQARVLPGCLLADRLGGRPLLIGVHDQGAASAFTAVRLAAGRIRSAEVGRAVVVVLAPAGAAVLLLGRAGSHGLAEVTIRRTRPAGRSRPARYLAPWAGLARALAARPEAPAEVHVRDDTLGYECRARFTAGSPDSPAPALSTAGTGSHHD